MKTNEKSEEKLSSTLGMSSLRVTDQMFLDITKAASEDDRSIQNEIRYLLKLGLQKRSSDK
jgi:hypothetical protein